MRSLISTGSNGNPVALGPLAVGDIDIVVHAALIPDILAVPKNPFPLEIGRYSSRIIQHLYGTEKEINSRYSLP
jgi:hypothetical protein